MTIASDVAHSFLRIFCLITVCASLVRIILWYAAILFQYLNVYVTVTEL